MKKFNYREGIDYKELSLFKDRSKKENKNVKSIVGDIIDSVKDKGDKALFDYTKKYDNVDINEKNIMISEKDIGEAYDNIDGQLLSSIKKAIKNIFDFHKKQSVNSWSDLRDGMIYGQVVRPLSSVGIYVPGGTAQYPSSVIMNAIPALVAGVKDIVMVTPPKNKIQDAVLVAAAELNIKKIYRIGGAQAVAALAFGTESVPKVDKIVGPGNIYVATAKRAVYGYVDIDMIAGPSEILVIADKTADPSYIAADLMSQAEHDILASSYLVTDDAILADEVKKEIERQKIDLSRYDIIDKSLDSYGAIILVKDINEAIDIANEIAPEHLELAIDNPFEKLPLVKNAGAVFLGHNSPEPLGDYMAGPNHVLPTSGTARFFSPLSVDDFIKKMSVLYYSRERLYDIKDDIVTMAQAEGLTAHANSIKVRFK